MSNLLFCLALYVLFAIARGRNSNNGDDGHNSQDGYSFHKFSGPVSGEIQPVYFQNRNQEQKVDYIANPDYSYSYGVKDPLTGNNQEHEETRNGDAVTGQYSVLQADGIVRIVKYTADSKNGFQAVVEYH